MLPTMPAREAVVLLLLWSALVTTCSLPTKGDDLESGKHLRTFRDLVLRKDQAHHREARAQKDCDTDSKPFTGQCNLDCRCIDGKWKCCRLRKNYENMTQEEIQRFTDAYLTASTDDRYRDAFRSLFWAYPSFACDRIGLRLNLYRTELVYHRILLVAMENLLRAVDCWVTLPFFDASLSFDKLYKDIILFEDGNFGGNGAEPDMCVQHGPFQKDNFTIPKPQLKGEGIPLSDCLQRNVSQSRTPIHWKVLQIVMTTPPSSAALVETGILKVLGSNMHLGIGGSMANIAAAVDPLFYVLHSFLDKIMATYQGVSREHMVGGGLWNHTVQSFPWLRNEDWLDTTELPNDVCIRYEASLARENAIDMGHYLALEFPRTSYLVHAYDELRHTPLDDIAASQLKEAIQLFRHNFATFSFNKLGFNLSNNWRGKVAESLPLVGDTVSRDLVQPVCKYYYPGFRRYNFTGGANLLLG